MATIFGTASSDVLFGERQGVDVIFGLGGDDLIFGSSGFDSIYGGSGRDSIYGGFSGVDVIFGGEDADYIVGFSRPDTLYGDGGDDTILGGNPFDDETDADFLNGGGGNDLMNGGGGRDTILGGNGNDSIANWRTPGDPDVPNNLSDLFLGEAGNDTLYGGDGADTLDGGTGNDRLIVTNLTGLRLEGASGMDTLELDNGGLVVNLFGTAGAQLLGIEEIVLGGRGNTLRLTAADVIALSDTDTLRIVGNSKDILIFEDAASWTQGASAGGFVSFTNGAATVIVSETLVSPPGPTNGNDVLSGSNGADTIDLAAGDDSYLGLAGDDSILGNAGNDTLDGGIGADTISGDIGDDIISGGVGTDWASYAVLAYASQSVTVELAALRATGAAGNDTLSGIENILGGAGNDSLSGDGNVNQLDGEAGNDTLSGGAGDDSLVGGAGTDWISYVDLTAATQAVTVNLATRLARDASGNDSLSSIENVVSGAGNDSLLGDSNANVLNGASGADTLSGGTGDDTLAGGFGADSLFGDAGSDLVSYAELAAASSAVTVNLLTQRSNGAAGNDTLFGIENVISGAGNDSLFGDGYANILLGEAGNDTLSGRAGDDSLSGGTGIDWVSYAELSDATQAVTVNLIFASGNWRGWQ